jgi:FAD/FMN-containing dehydrogenase
MTAALQDTAPGLQGKLKAGGTLQSPNTVSHRKVMAVLLRLLAEGEGRALSPVEELSARLDDADRRNTHNCWRAFVQAGSDVQAFCERQRKRTSAVHPDMAEWWRRDPLLPITAICQQVKARFGLAARSAAAVRQAARPLDYNPSRRALHRHLARGEVHYREEWLRAELFGAVEL